MMKKQETEPHILAFQQGTSMKFDLKTQATLFERLATYATPADFLKSLAQANPIKAQIQDLLEAVRQWSLQYGPRQQSMPEGSVSLRGALPASPQVRQAVQYLQAVEPGPENNAQVQRAVQAIASYHGGEEWLDQVFPKAYALYEALEQEAKAVSPIPAPQSVPEQPKTPAPPKHLTGRGLFQLFQTLASKVRSGQAPTSEELDAWHANKSAFTGRLAFLEKQLRMPQEHTPSDVQKWTNEAHLIQTVIDHLG
jgi:hypothetical protein